MVTQIQWGLAGPPSESGAERTSDGKWWLWHVPGLAEQVQCVTVTVDDDAEAHEVLVIFAHHPPRSDDTVVTTLRALAARFPSHVLATVRQDKAGWARVTCSVESACEAAAAAVAVVKYSGSWDDSRPIVVEIDDDCSFDAFVESRDNRWHTRVVRGA